MNESDFSFCVSKSYAGFRLDVFLRVCIKVCTRSYLANLLRDGKIYVDGLLKKPSYRVKEGDLVFGVFYNKKPLTVVAESIPLEIVYEDSDIIVINKKAGIVVHPSPGHSSNTIVNAIMYHCSDFEAGDGSIRPGVVHRLDKDTTGLLVFAKNSISMRHILFQFKSRVVEKFYLAIVHGIPRKKQGTIKFSIGRHPKDRKRMSIHSDKPRSARTCWRVLEEYGGDACLLEVNIKTGRTHQIRLHCKAIGHPVLGDPLYKIKNVGNKLLKRKPEVIQYANRQMLHAYRLRLKHPKNSKHVLFEARMPNDMIQLQILLGRHH